MRFACKERQRILLEAAIWQSLLQQSPSEENRSKFAAWLTKSRQHVEIYLYVAVRFPEFPETQPATPMLAPSGDRPTNNHSPLAWISAIGAAASLAAVGLWLYLHTLQPIAPVAGTVYQDEGSFPLEAGSIMTLRHGSRVTVYRSAEPRLTRVELDKGYAEFTGTHDRTSPLSVVSNNVVADVQGTTFDVFRNQGSTTVTVTEGQVRVTLNCPSADKSGSAPAEAVLTEGKYVEVAGDNCSGPLLVRSVEAASVKQRVASDSDWLDFAQKTVQEAAEQFNQYNVEGERLVVRSATLGNQLIGGRFHPSDVDSFLQVLKRNYNVKVTRHTEQDGSKVIYLDLATGK